MFELQGKTALVTGAGQGVGAEIAALLAAQGSAVGVNDLYPERAQATVDRIAAQGGRTAAAPADVRDSAAVGEMVQKLEGELGPVDILVNNAGLPTGDDFALVPFHETTPEMWEAWLGVSLYGVLHCTHAVIRGMRARHWGRVITIVSDAGRTGARMLAAYSAAKAGAMGFSRSLAKENGREGITCNCVALGVISRPAFDEEARLERILRQYPVGRIGEPKDVAPMVLYLASEEAAWFTGQTFGVNGGYLTS